MEAEASSGSPEGSWAFTQRPMGKPFLSKKKKKIPQTQIGGNNDQNT